MTAGVRAAATQSGPLDMLCHQNKLLARLAETGRCETTAELAAAVDLPKPKVSNAACKLIARGCVARRDFAGCYVITGAGRALIESGAQIGPGPRGARAGNGSSRKNSFRARLWRAIRIKDGQPFSVPELLALADDGSLKTPVNSAQKYISALEKAKVLIRLPRRQRGDSPTSNGFVVWCMPKACSLGPTPPVIKADGRVYDPNSSRFLSDPAADDVDAAGEGGAA